MKEFQHIMVKGYLVTQATQYICALLNSILYLYKLHEEAFSYKL